MNGVRNFNNNSKYKKTGFRLRGNDRRLFLGGLKVLSPYEEGGKEGERAVRPYKGMTEGEGGV